MVNSSDGKESACNTGDPGLIPGSGKFPGEGNGYPLQYSCLDNSMDRGTLLFVVENILDLYTHILNVEWLFLRLNEI